VRRPSPKLASKSSSRLTLLRKVLSLFRRVMHVTMLPCRAREKFVPLSCFLLLALLFVLLNGIPSAALTPPSSNLPNGTQRLYIVPPSNAAPQDMGWWQDLFRRSSSSRRAILVQEQPSPPSQPQQSLPSLQLEEGGGSLPPLPSHITFSTPPMANGSSSNGKKDNGKEPHNHRARVAGKGDIYDEDNFPSPASFSAASSAHSVLDDITERLHHLPKWQYRLLCGSLWFTLLLLGILLSVSIVYGFGLKYVHFSVPGTTPLVPALVDTHGNIPLRATLRLDNPNIFPIAAAPTTTTLSSVDRTNGKLYPLVTAPVPRIYLHSREKGHIIHSDFVLKDLGKLPGGAELTTAALKGKATFLHSTTTLRLHVKALGFVPIVRVFQVKCYIATLWGEPTRPDGSKETVSDCMGTFL